MAETDDLLARNAELLKEIERDERGRFASDGSGGTKETTPTAQRAEVRAKDVKEGHAGHPSGGKYKYDHNIVTHARNKGFMNHSTDPDGHLMMRNGPNFAADKEIDLQPRNSSWELHEKTYPGPESGMTPEDRSLSPSWNTTARGVGISELKEHLK